MRNRNFSCGYFASIACVVAMLLATGCVRDQKDQRCFGEQHQSRNAGAGEAGEECRKHGYLPLWRARRMELRSLLISVSLRSISDIRNSAVTACSGLSPK